MGETGWSEGRAGREERNQIFLKLKIKASEELLS